MNESLDEMLVDSFLVNRELLACKGRSSTPVDGIPGEVLSKYADDLTVPLTNLFSRCVHQGYFPNLWKEGRIVPIPKNKRPSDVKHYRPITMLPILSKVFERILFKTLFNHVQNVLPSNQHAVAGRSVSTNLLQLISHIQDAFESRCQLDVFYSDIQAAYDSIPISMLLFKLEHMCNIKGQFLLNTLNLYALMI